MEQKIESILIPHNQDFESMSSTLKHKPSSIPLLLQPPESLFPTRDELVAVLAIATSVAFSFNFFYSAILNPQSKPFCDDFLTDSCEPCPVHGQCREGELQCDQGYKKHGKLCVEDALIQETANKLVPENEIINDLDNHELAEYVGSDINRMLDGRTNSLGVKELKCPDMLADQYKPYSCCIRQWTSEQALLIFPICAAACEELEDKALMNRVNDKCKPWVVASTLRDSLLSLKERKNPILWRKVEELVQEDSRVDCYPKLVKGESRVVWEWKVEGSLSSSRKKKKGEASKLNSSQFPERSHQHHHTLEADQRQWDSDITILRQ